MPSQSYEHPALTADVVLFALGQGAPTVLLIRRGKPPFQGSWAFPGGFVNVGEPPRVAASRELEEETGIGDVQLEQLRVFGDPGRDPRGHVVSVAYLAVLPISGRTRAAAGSDARRARWWSIDELPGLAFDHDEILTCALQRLRTILSCSLIDNGSEHARIDDLSIGALGTARRAIERKLEEGHDVAGVDQQ